MDRELILQKLIFLDENQLNPNCFNCGKELSAFLISEKYLNDFFTPEELGFLLQENLIRYNEQYAPKLTIYLCRHCCKAERM